MPNGHVYIVNSNVGHGMNQQACMDGHDGSGDDESKRWEYYCMTTQYLVCDLVLHSPSLYNH